MKEKVFGEYLPYNDTKHKNIFDNLDELSTFLIIYDKLVWNGLLKLNNEFLSINNQNLEEHVTECDGEELDDLYIAEYLVYHTRNFGVKFKEKPQAGKHVDLNNEMFLKWFNFWNKHFQKIDSNGLNAELSACIETGCDYSKFLPTVRWNEGLTNSQDKNNKTSSSIEPQGPQ